MPLFLVELHPGLWPSHGEIDCGPAPKTHGWRMFASCHEDDALTCELLFSDPEQFSARTYSDFLSFLEWLFAAAKGGQSWAAVFRDGNLFHPVHQVKVQRRQADGSYKESTVTVLQFKKKRTDIRLLTLQEGIGRLNVFISQAFEKDGQKTPAREQSRSEANIRAFFHAMDTETLQLVTSQGGKNATEGIFNAVGK